MNTHSPRFLARRFAVATLVLVALSACGSTVSKTKASTASTASTVPTTVATTVTTTVTPTAASTPTTSAKASTATATSVTTPPTTVVSKATTSAGVSPKQTARTTVLGALYSGGFYAIGEWTGSAWTKIPATLTPGAYQPIDGTVAPNLQWPARTDEHKHAVIDALTDPDYRVRTSIAVSSTPWTAKPRVARTTNTLEADKEHALDGSTFDVYRAEATRLMASHGGATSAPRLQSITRVDLDGDGAEEVFVVATNHETVRPIDGPLPDLTPGSYTVLYVRHVVGNTTKSDIIWSDVATPDHAVLPQISVTAIADFNGDGTMEVVGTRKYFEDPIYYVWDAGSATRNPSTIFSPEDF
jgi:hypothetical protein